MSVCFCFFAFETRANDNARTAGDVSSPGDYHIFLDDPMPRPYVTPVRPKTSKISDIERNTALTNIKEQDNIIAGCLTTRPHDHISVMTHISQATRVMANNTKNTIEAFSFQPHFSGLMGPNITLMRKDIEQLAVHHQGSPNEIYHNAQFKSIKRTACDKSIRHEWDIALKHHIDAWDTDNPALVRSDIVLTDRYHFGGYFLATVSARYTLYDNLDKDPDLRILNTPRPTRQDYYGYRWQKLNMERIMLSTFTTPTDHLYLGLHGGFVEEMFFGLGGEFLYRPHNRRLSVGAELWGTIKRIPYTGNVLTLDDSNKQTSALLNLWYDMPKTPISFGLSAGQFLDDDTGYQWRARYTPAPGWRIEGHVTYSNDSDQSLDHNKDTNWIFGARLSMPLGQLHGLPDNSSQEFKVEPMARDHGQRIDNAYALYDLTDPWQSRNLYRYWDMLDN